LLNSCALYIPQAGDEANVGLMSSLTRLGYVKRMNW
jgi:hypothetical protein